MQSLDRSGRPHIRSIRIDPIGDDPRRAAVNSPGAKGLRLPERLLRAQET